MEIKPSVSVVMITYGHENYILQAIESVLMQNADFSIELIISNDASPDATNEIIKKVIDNHPKSEFIRYFNHKKNIGMMPNFIFALQKCKNKYVAICEGDDYWIDPLKLSKQIAFLESNKDFVLTFHNAKTLNVISDNKGLFVDKYKFTEYNAENLFDTWLIPTASMVFRNVLDENYPDFFYKSTHGDLALQVYLNEFGKFNASNEIMSTYRINESSVTINNFSSLKHNNEHICQLKMMNHYFNKKYQIQIQKRIFLYYLRNANSYRRRSIIKPAYWIFKALSVNPTLIAHYKKQFLHSLKIMFYTFRVLLKIKK